jgi:hypothetical protein
MRGTVARSRFERVSGRCLRCRWLGLEWLEDRTLFSASPLDAALPLQFNAQRVVQAEHFLSRPAEFALYRVTLQAGDTLEAGISAQDAGNQAGAGFTFAFPGFAYQGISPLSSLLRVFDAAGKPLALDDQQGGDPSLTFQATTAGIYYLGVSSAPNNNYDPTVAGSGSAGGTTGLYTLGVRLVTGGPLLPDLTGSLFRTSVDMAAPGDAVPVQFTVQNRGGADPGSFQVEVLLAHDNRFDSSAQVLATLPRGALVASATGRDLSSPTGFSVTVPASELSGPMFLGLRIVADPSVPEAGLYDKSGVHRGEDWEWLKVVTRAPAGVTDLSAVNPGLFTETTGTAGPNELGVYSFTVSSTLGNGELTAEVAAGGALRPRLTLSGPQGQVLIQSDSGRIVQSLQPGMYLVTVSAASGAGDYRLTTAFAQTSQPLAPLTTGAGPASVAVTDIDGDGTPDIIMANRIDQTISVYLGNGDGTFQPPKPFAAGPRIWRVTVGDVVNDGKPAILVGNKGNNTVSVLLGNGDGTFQPQIIVPAGTRVAGATAADVDGDGKPDLLMDNYAADTIWVVKGNGDRTFGPPAIYPTDDHGRFQGAQEATVADVNGDGIPDLIYETYVGGDEVVRLGNGDGTFGPEWKFPTAPGSYGTKVVDLKGDGKPDLVVVNAVGNSVSVLLGNGDGTFQPEKVYPVGTNPYSMTVADLNGDGIPDIITSNRDDNTVSVLLGNGDGTFQPARTFQTGKTPRRVAVGDFNGDGRLDLVTANEGDNTASVLLGNGDGTFSSGGQAAPAPDLRPFQVAVADLNGDGRPDIVTANRSDNSVGVLLRNPDGSFQTKETFATGRQPFSVAVADLNGDGIPDIVTANYAGDSVSVLLGNGDGTFRPHVDYPAGSADYDVVVADLAGDGKQDIIVTDKNDNTVGVLLGDGDGTFQPMKSYPVASGPYEVVAKDLTGNGKLDLVVSHFSATVVDMLMGNGDGTFQPAREFPVGSRPYGLAVADLNGDGIPDIVTANYRSADVSVLLGDGHGNFGPPTLLPVGLAPNEVQVTDLNGDGIPDLVTANYGGNSVSVLLGNGNGTFRPARTFAAGDGPASVAVADLNRNGKLDLVVGNRKDSTVSVLLGNGDGTFQAPLRFGAGKNKYSAAVADLTGDGKQDVVTTNLRQNTVSVRLGNGDGTFAPPQTVAVGPAPTAVAVADLNGDGRPDLVTADSYGNYVSVLLGNGDGTFHQQQTFAVGRSPRRVVVADLRGDGIPDLVVTNYNDNTVSVLLGNGDGTFAPQEVYPVGPKPYGLVVADVTGDGKPDILVANSAGDTVSVLLGNGDGTFQPQETFATGRQPFSVAVADINGDGKLDLITANAFDNTVSVLSGNPLTLPSPLSTGGEGRVRGDGTFGPGQTFAVGSRPYSLAVAEVTGDGKPDLVTTNYGDNSVTVLLNNGAGSFPTRHAFPTDKLPVQTVVADVNGDGIPDLVTVSNHDSAIGVLVGKGDRTFLPVTAATGVGLRDTPFLVNLTGSGPLDSVVLDRSGNILYRKGLVGSNNAFAPPVILNLGRPARDITILNTGSGLAIAAADAHFDSTLSTNQFVFTVSFYTVAADGSVSRSTAFATPALPVRLATADLAGTGRADLIAVNSLDNSVTIALQTVPGRFAVPLTLPVGITPSDIAVADVNGDGLLDIAVSDQSSGDVSVLHNDAAHTFTNTLRFRAAIAPNSLAATSGGPALISSAQSVSVVAGNFTGSGRSDLVVVNAGAHSFTVLPNDGNAFADPQFALTASTSDGLSINQQPGAVVAGDFNRDGNLDLAVLLQDTGQVWIYTGQGDGTFRHTFSIPVGDQASGLSIVPGTSPGLLDLLVGNGFGDVLHLQGKGDGTFQISGNRVSLSVVPDLLGNGQAGVLVGNQHDNRVTIQAPTASGTQFAPVQTLGGANASAQLAPGDVHWFLLDKNATLPDPVVVSSGSNAVIVYRTTGIQNGVLSFAPPQTYFVGTAPASVTVADLNGDGIPDMVIANQGSNDVSVLFGSYDASGHWIGTPGPRLKSGGAGPLAVTVRDQNGDGSPDLVVTNGGSGTITLLKGVGQGFFDDQHPQTLFDLGGAVVQTPTFVGDSGIGYAVTANGELVRFDLDNPGGGVRVVFSGQVVLAAQAQANGLVVVALAGGTVEVLVPQGDGLGVATELRAQAGVPVLPSALQVLRTASGQLQVLVSSQGSDTIFVFAAAVIAPPSPVNVPPLLPPRFVFVPGIVEPVPSPGESLQPVNSASPTSVSQTQGSTAPTNRSTLLTLGGTDSSGTSATSSSSSVSTTVSATAGISFNSVVSHETSVSSGAGEADLVPIQGNTYATVAVLDFGFAQDDDLITGGRMPWLSTRLPIGGLSPLTRFVIGQQEALQDYRGGREARATEDKEALPIDPWNEDLFQRRPPLLPPIHDPADDEPMEAGRPEALLPTLDQFRSKAEVAFELRFWQKCADDPRFFSSVGRVPEAAELEVLAILLASVALPAPRLASTNRRVSS